MDKREAIICPRTQLPCAGKEWMVGSIGRVAEGQIANEVKLPPPDSSDSKRAERYQKILGEEISRQDAKRAGIERDLKADCIGSICGPLAQMASRFLFDGKSYDEYNEQHPPKDKGGL